MNCTDAFPDVLKKKIDKTAEARGGDGIYKRRNSRTYRVIMHLNTYKNSNCSILCGIHRSFLGN
ncbi:uncharacterized protein ig2599ANME_2047 [groundwater metagenome]